MRRAPTGLVGSVSASRNLPTVTSARQLDEVVAAKLLTAHESVLQAEQELLDARILRSEIVGDALESGASVTAIANELGMTTTAVRHMARRAQRPPPRRFRSRR